MINESNSVIERTAADFVSQNPVLLLNQIGIESDTLLQKVGDCVTAWNDLDYTTPSHNAFEQVLSCDETKVPSSKAVCDALVTGAEVHKVLTDYIATENISIFDVVTSDGKVGNSAIVSQRNKIIGLSKTATLIGFMGTAIGFGEITNGAWTWTIGDKIFLNGTTLSTVAPSSGFSILIGTAIGTDTIKIELQPSIRF